MKPLDNWFSPVSVIKEAECLTAAAFHADKAFFMINGTTAATQCMIMSVCKPFDKIILPRNVHKSIINAMVLCGAVPVYVNPSVNTRLGIPLAAAVSDVEAAISANPDAKAVLVNNPTYYGVCPDIRAIAKAAHANGMYLLADEAHGTHFYFGEGLPAPAMTSGADMSSVSMHKSGGSLTQSSVLLLNESEHLRERDIRQIINLTGTTSASYILMSSLDISRKNLAVHGKEIFAKVKGMAGYAREEINRIGDYYAFSEEITDGAAGSAAFDFDETKLAVNTISAGLAGIEVYDLLRDEFDIQAEFGDISNILAYVSVGDRERDIERLVSALSEIRRLYKRETALTVTREYLPPQVKISPREAFYSKHESVSIDSADGEISAELVMCYPPGIPIVAPGEIITGDLIRYIKYAQKKGCLMTGMRDSTLSTVTVCK
jgi:arginine/lysine/ornithine decarboxylase